MKKVDLSDIFTSRQQTEIPHVLEAFAEALADKEELEELILSDNAFGPIGAKPLTELISRNYGIKELIMNNNGLGPEGVKHISQALISAHRKAAVMNRKPKLVSVELGRNRIGDDGAAHLSEAIRLYSDQISKFELPQNGISGPGFEHLFDSLSRCRGLLHLNLQDNTFNIQGSMAFAKAAPQWELLSFLNISDCLLTPEGGIQIIKALIGGNRFLKHIDIGYGDIDRRGAMLIPKMLENKLLLLYLGINGNTFSPEGPHMDRIRSVLSTHDRCDSLGALDEMDYESDHTDEDIEYTLSDEEGPVVILSTPDKKVVCDICTDEGSAPEDDQPSDYEPVVVQDAPYRPAPVYAYEFDDNKPVYSEGRSHQHQQEALKHSSIDARSPPKPAEHDTYKEKSIKSEKLAVSKQESSPKEEEIVKKGTVQSESATEKPQGVEDQDAATFVYKIEDI